MAKQDDWVRITLRVPADLHEQLNEAADAGSMNAEIIERLRWTFAFEAYGQELGKEQDVALAALGPAAHFFDGKFAEVLNVLADIQAKLENDQNHVPWGNSASTRRTAKKLIDRE